jgi:RpiB/LacA/LacB family sugar-phosphate isomerase
MKPNILVPMAGLGSRFIKEGFKVPKQLINIKDKHLIDISLDCLDYKNCNLIFVVRDETVYNFHIDELLKKKFGDDIKIVILDKLTDGSVCSCLYAEEYIDNDSPLIIHTLDIEFRPVFDPHTMKDLNADGLLLTFKSNSANYSYADVDENGYVKKTAEKKAISSNACVGIYGFKRGSDFCKYAREMIEKDIRTKNEFYIAPLYNLLVDDGKKIITSSVDKMHVFGTPDEFHFYKENVIRKIGDKPIAICSDHSGFEAKEEFKHILEKHNLEYIDFGTILNKDCDYSDYIAQAVKAISERDCDYGFGFCRTGQGVNICANKYKGIRSALIYDDFSMEMAIRHNCANFFAIPAKDYTVEKLDKYLEICSIHSFDGGRHQVRIQELEK